MPRCRTGRKKWLWKISEATGLPASAVWYVNITGGPSSGPILSNESYTFILNDGTYGYSAGVSSNDYSASPGTITVQGKQVYTSVPFRAMKYGVTFEESGLMNNTLWTVVFNGQAYKTASNTYVFAEFNGTYTYDITNVTGYTVSGQTAQVVVNGHNVTVSVVFKRNSTSPEIPPDLVYGIAGAGAAVVIGAIAYSIIRKRK